MQVNFILRTLAIYWRDKWAIFWSLFASLITLLIYIFFLRANLLTSLPSHVQAGKFLDLWMIAGLISVLCVSASLTPFEQRIKDVLTHKQDDFRVNNHMSKLSLSVSYLVVAIIETSVSVLLFILFAFGYLYLENKKLITWMMFGQTIFWAFLLILFGCLFFACVTNLVHSLSVFSSLSGLVGALTGFLCGSYIPVGSLPHYMQVLVDKWPGFEFAGIMRHIMVKNFSLPSSYQSNLFKDLGILSNGNQVLTVFLVWIFVLFVIWLLELRWIKKD